MEFKNYTYLLLMLGLLVISLAFSFEKKVRFYTKLRHLVPAILFSGAIFILWDIRFEKLGIWSFNPDYLLGIYILNLPLEEWLFYLVVPYFSILVYEVLTVRFAKFEKPNLFLAISLVLLAAFALAAYFFRPKVYTFFTFFLLAIYFGYTIFRNKFKQHYTKFYLTWLILLIPFAIIYSTLTALPIVEYNDTYNLGVRIFTIPIENFFCFFLLLLMNTTIYEYMKKQHFFL
ncbi:lycopene cyclase domain-containing protein [Mariniphaga anaerophila]|uniref:Lycopene cyclase domain-containing protein n=1 Tax=Mariniphaga anaerophila TaxID=1484053 RepID=A0A1M5BH57_9BACT|nr:lycopene cyclase domain-containing protein [Mariniphaga anaerophila]SHF41597.1 lycopene cyclase domain-containing protein [Mariniphaga anaerophila]